MYTWKTNLYKDADADKVYGELSYYGLEDGLHPEEIVEKAKNENTELHKCFTWDDTEAARKYRIEEARDLCANITVKIETKDASKPIFQRVIEITKSGYKPLEVIVKHEDEYADLLRRAKNELISFQNRYSMLKELNPIFEAINQIV